VLVLQANEFNVSRIHTVIVVALTSNVRLARAPGNVLLPKSATGLKKNSVANVSQVLTIDKAFLTSKVGSLALEFLERIESGVRLVLKL
jgi:mRNA interferase MazF